MAWSYTKTGSYVAGSKRFTFGTYANTAANTGGLIDTGLESCDFFLAQPAQAAVVASANAVVAATLLTGHAVQLVTLNGTDGGVWWAFGPK